MFWHYKNVPFPFDTVALWAPFMCSLACTSQGAGDLPAASSWWERWHVSVHDTVLFHQMQDFTSYKRLLIYRWALFAMSLFFYLLKFNWFIYFRVKNGKSNMVKINEQTYVLSPHVFALKGDTLSFSSPCYAPILWSGSPHCATSLQTLRTPNRLTLSNLSRNGIWPVQMSSV